MHSASHSKINFYRQNGTGRDTYIGFNSGGNHVGKIHQPSQLSGSFAIAPVYHAATKAARSPERPVHYNMDGTGRDTYIHVNQGGFAASPALKDSSTSFVESLRYYRPSHGSRSPKKRDYFMEGQLNQSPKARKQ
jgi:hypothetical protein